ncbi:hypothetical protein B0H13DRAFT_1650852, partial [Mycena leptocephala]
RDARSKLVIITSNKTVVKSKDKSTSFIRYRAIYQCMCGSDNAEGRHASKKRQIGWENVDCGCCLLSTSMSELTICSIDHVLLTIDELIGDFSHSAPCQDTEKMIHNPRIPLHPLLREYALSLLRKNIPLPQLRQHCRDWAHERWGTSVGDSSHRYVLADHESTSLYRTIAQESGISQGSAAQDNIHLWFNSEKPQPPDPCLSAARIAYSPYIPGKTERFSIILMTPEQKLLAWKFGHRKQMLMDLTFGFCSGRALLAIMMVLDDQNKGLLVAFLMFTAKKQTKAVHADYDKVLLTEQLELWKEGMGRNEAGEEFDPYVGGTDYDPRERHGLRTNWPLIILLLCLFHVWQAWRNGLNKYLRIIPKGPDRQLTRQHLAKFLMRLLKVITDYDEAISEYNAQVTHFKNIAKARNSGSLAKNQSKGALGFLAYLQGYLKARELWESWSLAGAEAAARRMNVPLSHVARTTNPLESFNGRIKGVYFAPYMHSGRLPRIDNWILIMITRVLPEFFERWAERREQKLYYTDMRTVAPKPDSKVIPRSRMAASDPNAPPLPKPLPHSASTTRTSLTDPLPSNSTPDTLIAAAKRWLDIVLNIPLVADGEEGEGADPHSKEFENSLMAQVAGDDGEDSEDDEPLNLAIYDVEGFGTCLVVSAAGGTIVREQSAHWRSDNCYPHIHPTQLTPSFS